MLVLVRDTYTETLKHSLSDTPEDVHEAISLELTFASLHALRPPVVDLCVACTSAVLEPSTARSAATGSAGFHENAAPWARHRIRDR